MAVHSTRTSLCCLCGLVLCAGCDLGPPPTTQPSRPSQPTANTICYKYLADDVEIMPLTELKSDRNAATIDVYVSLLDRFGCQVKSPAVFRFELYAFVPGSPQPKGRRLMHWPDVDLTDPATNNGYWHDYLRAYRFTMPLAQKPGSDLILQVTCMTPQGRRLSDTIVLEAGK